MSLLGLVCRITEISNPSLRKERKIHKRRSIGACTVSTCTRVISILILFGGGNALVWWQKINKKLQFLKLNLNKNLALRRYGCARRKRMWWC